MDPKAILDATVKYGLPTVIAGLLGWLLILQSSAQSKQDAESAATIAALTAQMKQQTDLTRDEIDFLAKMVDNACGKK